MAENVSQKTHSVWKFWWLCAKEAWNESREKFGLVVDLLVVFSALGLVWFAWYSKRHPNFDSSKENDAMSYWFAVIPAGLWVMWFLYHVPKAAHKIYKEEVEAAETKHAKEIAEKDSIIKNLESGQSDQTKLDNLGACLVQFQTLLNYAQTSWEITDWTYVKTTTDKIVNDSAQLLSHSQYARLLAAEPHDFPEPFGLPTSSELGRIHLKIAKLEEFIKEQNK